MTELPNPRILTVTELTRSIRGILETEFPFISVSGEISNLRQPHSGHLYFTLKDDASQIRAVLFKQQQKYLRELPEDGMQILCRGRVSVYEPRGEYQLIIDYLERSGIGELQTAFENLKQKLEAEGLFDQAAKKELPRFPARIALLTSPEGAAVFDFLRVALHRFPSQPIEILPVRVQGAEAVPDICDGLAALNRSGRSEIIVLCRGGGSIEDLWSFNDERLARAIFASDIPVVTAIGHEIDFTIADFVADLRAPTPTAAAEMVVPGRQAIAELLQGLGNSMYKAVAGQLRDKKYQVEMQRRRLGDPRSIIFHNLLHLDNTYSSLIHNTKGRLFGLAIRLETLAGRLHKLSPAQQLAYKKQWSAELARRLRNMIRQDLDRKRERLNRAVSLLEAVSPLGVLGRGYAVVRSGPGEKPPDELIRSASQVSVGKNLEIILQQGRIGCEVTQIKEDGRDERI